MNLIFSKTIKIIAALFVLISTHSVFAQTISPYMYGQNHWMADGDHGRVGYLADLWPRVGESGVTMVRIGGNGYEREFPPRTKLDAMVRSIRSIGAEPLLQVPRHFSSEATKELVEYYTRNDRKKILYWSIGNEPQLHQEYSVEEIHEYLLRIAKVMKAAAPEIKILIYDEAWLRMPEYGDLIGGRLDLSGIKENNSWLIDGVTFHHYPFGKQFTRDDVVFVGPEKILKQIVTLKGLIKNANAKHNRTGADALIWGMTEFNVSYDNPNREVSGHGNPSFLGGQFMAEVFAYGIQYDAFSMMPWCINETDAVATDFGYLGLPKEFYPRSSYYHMQMMSRNLKGSYAPSQDNQDYIKTIAAKNESSIAIMVMNQHQTQNFAFTMSFNGNLPKTSKALAMTIDGKISASFDGEIPAQTTQLLVFDNKGKLQKTITYGLEQNLAHLAPIEK
jgi:hypothetical protein